MSWVLWFLFSGGGLIVVGLIGLAIFWSVAKPFRQAIIAVAVCGALGLGCVAYGVSLEAAACNARELAEKLRLKEQELAAALAAKKLLEERVAALNETLRTDGERAAAAEQKLKEAKERADALEKQIADGACYGPADTDGLRQLWGIEPGAKGPGRGRNPANAGRSKALPQPHRRGPAAPRVNDKKTDIQPDRAPEEFWRRQGRLSVAAGVLLRGRWPRNLAA